MNRNVVGLSIHNLLRGLAVGGFQAMFGVYAYHLGYDMAFIGLSAAISLSLSAIIAPLYGVLIDTVGSRFSTSLSGMIQAASLIILMNSTSIEGLILAHILFITAFTTGQPARVTFLARSVPESKLGSYIGVTTLFFSSSRIAGPVVAGFVAAKRGFPEAFGLLATASMLGVALFLAITKPIESESRFRASVNIGRVLEAYKMLVKPPRGLGPVFGVAAVDRLGWSLWFPLLSAHLYRSGFSEEAVGVLVAFMTLIQTISLPALGRLADSIGPRAVLALAEASGAAGLITLAVSKSPTLVALALALLGVSIGGWIPAFNKVVAMVSASSRLGESFAATNSVRILISSPMPLLGGRIYEALGPIPVLLAAATLIAVAGALTTTLPLKGKGLGAPHMDDRF